jgi:DNA primase
LETVEGLVAARTVVPGVIAQIKEETLREAYAVHFSSWLRLDPNEALKQVRQQVVALQGNGGGRGGHRRPAALTRPGNATARDGQRGKRGDVPPEAIVPLDRDEPTDEDHPPDPLHEVGSAGARELSGPAFRRPDPKDQNLKAEREALKLALQQPDLVAAAYQQVQAESFTEPAYAQIHRAIDAAGGPSMDRTGPVWVDAVREQLPAGPLRTLVGELAVDRPEWPSDQVEGRYAGAILARLAERVALIEERNLHSALQRAEAAGEPDRVRELLGQLVEAANYRRALSDRAKDQV